MDTPFQVGDVVQFPRYYTYYDIVVLAGAIGRIHEVTEDQLIVETGPALTQLPMKFEEAYRNLCLYARPTQTDRLHTLPEWAREEILQLRLDAVKQRAALDTRVSTPGPGDENA